MNSLIGNNSEIRLSIALVTRNRPSHLEKALESIFRQSKLPFEVIISDDSNEDIFIMQNKKLAAQYKSLYFRGPQNGLYANRNFVAKQCKGTHIRTMDDDHELPENHFSSCYDVIELEPNVIWTIGEYYPETKIRLLPPPAPGQLHARGFAYIPKKMDNYYGISCGATIYPRQIIDSNVLNCELYRFGCLFLEYGVRLRKKGWTIKLVPSTFIVHSSKESFGDSNYKNHQLEARLYSMFCFSFKYQKTLTNMALTIFEILSGLLIGNFSLKNLKNAYFNFRKIH